jgi:hypothetical protein
LAYVPGHFIFFMKIKFGFRRQLPCCLQYYCRVCCFTYVSRVRTSSLFSLYSSPEDLRLGVWKFWWSIGPDRGRGGEPETSRERPVGNRKSRLDAVGSTNYSEAGIGIYRCEAYHRDAFRGRRIIIIFVI